MVQPLSEMSSQCSSGCLALKRHLCVTLLGLFSMLIYLLIAISKIKDKAGIYCLGFTVGEPPSKLSTMHTATRLNM